MAGAVALLSALFSIACCNRCLAWISTCSRPQTVRAACQMRLLVVRRWETLLTVLRCLCLAAFEVDKAHLPVLATKLDADSPIATVVGERATRFCMPKAMTNVFFNDVRGWIAIA